jgi:hypothetical protein
MAGGHAMRLCTYRGRQYSDLSSSFTVQLEGNQWEDYQSISAGYGAVKDRLNRGAPVSLFGVEAFCFLDSEVIV